MYVNRERSVLQRLGIACIGHTFAGRCIYADMEMPGEIAVLCRFSSHVKIVFDVALRIINVRYNNALQCDGLSFSGRSKLTPYPRIALLWMIRFAAGLHNIVNTEYAAAFAGLCQLYIQRTEQLACSNINKLLFINGQHTILQRCLFAELYIFYADIINFKPLTHFLFLLHEKRPCCSWYYLCPTRPNLRRAILLLCMAQITSAGTSAVSHGTACSNPPRNKERGQHRGRYAIQNPRARQGTPV